MTMKLASKSSEQHEVILNKPGDIVFFFFAAAVNGAPLGAKFLADAVLADPFQCFLCAILWCTYVPFDLEFT